MKLKKFCLAATRDQPPVAAGTSLDLSANAILQEVSAAPSRRRRLPLWLERCAAEGPAKKSTSTPEADALTNVDFDSFGGGSQLCTQWTSFQGDGNSRQDVDAGSPSLSILAPHQAPVSNNDAVRQLEVDSPTTINSTTTWTDTYTSQLVHAYVL